MSADLDIQAQTAAPAEKKLWQEPRLTCLALNQTATGNFIEAPEGGVFEYGYKTLLFRVLEQAGIEDMALLILVMVGTGETGTIPRAAS